MLRKFIRLLLREESVYNYWMRRPRNSVVHDVSNEIEQDRAMTYAPVADSFNDKVGGIMHSIQTAGDLGAIQNSFEREGLDAYEIVEDPGRFENAVKSEDLAAIKMQLISGLKRWSQAKLDKSDDEYDTYSLVRSLDV